jgi:hypothetical protein
MWQSSRVLPQASSVEVGPPMNAEASPKALKLLQTAGPAYAPVEFGASSPIAGKIGAACSLANRAIATATSMTSFAGKAHARQVGDAQTRRSDTSQARGCGGVGAVVPVPLGLYGRPQQRRDRRSVKRLVYADASRLGG